MMRSTVVTETDIMFGQERANLSRDFIVRTDVPVRGEPSFQLVKFRSLARYYANSHLSCPLVIGTVKSNGGDRIAAKAFARPFEQRVFSSRFEFHVTDKVKHPTVE